MTHIIHWICRWCGREYTKAYRPGMVVNRPRICVECFITLEEGARR